MLIGAAVCAKQPCTGEIDHTRRRGPACRRASFGARGSRACAAEEDGRSRTRAGTLAQDGFLLLRSTFRECLPEREPIFCSCFFGSASSRVLFAIEKEVRALGLLFLLLTPGSMQLG
jgi:hypothetical protein